jgi:hypothetical protein
MHTQMKYLTLASVALVLALAAPADAQRVNSAGRAMLTDISGTAITTGDMVSGMLLGGPGTVQTYVCSVASGVRNASILLTADLGIGRLQVVSPNPGPIIVERSLQEDLLVVLSGAEARRAAAGALVDGLTPQGNDGRPARGAAEELVRLLDGMLALAYEMDPEHAGPNMATRLNLAVGQFNTFVNVSSEAFLHAPTQEFLAVQSILSRLVIAAMEHEDRPELCGVEVVFPLQPIEDRPPPPPPAERAASICLFVDDDLREVSAIVIPSTGDSLVVVNGERRPLSEVYPSGDSVHALAAALVASDDPIELLGQRYVKFGSPRVVSPSDVTRAGDRFRGVVLFQPTGSASPPEVLYVPVGNGCVVQPYEQEVEVMQVRG